MLFRVSTRPLSDRWCFYRLRLVSAWHPADHRDAILVPIQRGALPAVIEALRAQQTFQGFRCLMVGDALALGGVPGMPPRAPFVECLTSVVHPCG